jgi:hypothetical protein
LEYAHRSVKLASKRPDDVSREVLVVTQFQTNRCPRFPPTPKGAIIREDSLSGSPGQQGQIRN